MVNENIVGKEYNPTPVYNRKLLRNMIRVTNNNKRGSGANKVVGAVFHDIRGTEYTGKFFHKKGN